MDSVQQERELIIESGMFDCEWYATNYPDVVALGLDPVDHFLQFGAWMLRNPSRSFNTAFYLQHSPDVASAGINPLVHYITFGKKEGRVCHEEELATRKREARRYKNFSEFLAHTLLAPVISAPFVEEDKRCFAVMDNIARHLSGLAAQSAADTLVSVIMPVHNRVDLVGAAIDSVLQQDYRNVELIIIDDGSDDGTTKLLAALTDPRIVVLRNDVCNGASRARNKGLACARGKYIAYLDSDNLWDTRYLSAMVGAFIAVPATEALYSGQLLFRGDGAKPFAARFGSLNPALLENRNYIDLNAFCHTHEAYRRVGGFDEALHRYVDWDLILRMAHATRMISVPVLLSHYFYDKADNTVTNDATHVEQHLIVREKQALRTQMPAPQAAQRPAGGRPVSVIIPSYEALHDLKECIDSVLALQAADWITLIVVDNASSQPVLDYLAPLADSGQIKLIANHKNYGFTYAVNQGIGLAPAGSDIFLLNNDAILTSTAIAELQQAAYRLPDCAMVVPQQRLPARTQSILDHVPYANPEYACDVNASAHHGNVINVPTFHDGKIIELNFAPFFCVYIKRDVLAKSPGLDAERGRHYRSDRIFCDYVRNVMGMRIYQVTAAIVHHKLQKSTECLRDSGPAGGQFEDIFNRNHWNDDELRAFGFKRPAWDS